MPSVAERTRAEVQVRSRRFGSFDVPHDRVLEFPHGLIGFPTARRFVIVDHRPGSPFRWMLAVDDPDVAFAVADPSDLIAGYAPPVALVARLLGIPADDVGLFVIVTIPTDPTTMTVNLMAPIAVDMPRRRARQLVLDDTRWEAAERVFAPPAAARPES